MPMFMDVFPIISKIRNKPSSQFFKQNKPGKKFSFIQGNTSYWPHLIRDWQSHHKGGYQEATEKENCPAKYTKIQLDKKTKFHFLLQSSIKIIIKL